MKRIWSPETASKAYIGTIKHCGLHKEFGAAELISAMAAGWNSKLIAETWSKGGPITTSIALEIASQHTGGRHVCVVPDEDSKSAYTNAMDSAGMTSSSVEVIVGEAEEAMATIQGIDFMVVDCRWREYSSRVLRAARMNPNGAVLVCKNANVNRVGWRGVVEGGRRVVRTVFSPVGKGLDIAYIGAVNRCGCGGGSDPVKRRWIKHIDRSSGEVHVIRT